MAKAPQRITLHDQLLALLREGILNARWKRELPRESELCHEFQVSRMTLRKALAQLAAQGWITLGGRGKPHQIRRRPQKRGQDDARTLRVLTPYHFRDWSSVTHVMMKSIVDRVATEGYRIEIETNPKLFKHFRAAKLAQLNALPDTAGWLLMYATNEIQQWFADSTRPSVVIGRVHEAVRLPCVYPDTPAAARHAAGVLYARGHRELVYLIATLTSLNDRIAAEAFASEALRLGARPRIVTYDSSHGEMIRALRNLIAERPSPTGFVTGASETAITLLCHLLAANVQIPAQANVIALWADQHLNFTHPSIAHYRVDGETYGHRIAEMILKSVRNRGGATAAAAVMPEYVMGGSVAQRDLGGFD